MDIKNAIEKRRSIRKFKQIPLKKETLLELIRLGRLYSSAMNAQPIRFALITKKENRDPLFSSLNWAMRLHPYKIEEDERPMAYVLLLGKEEESSFFDFDAGSAAATVMLAASGFEIENCCLKIPNPKEVAKLFDFGEYIPYYAIALGKGKVKSSITDANDSISYYLDDEENFVVPKRSEKDVLIFSDME